VAQESWTIKGEPVLSRDGTVFRPCVLSLGQHPPTERRFKGAKKGEAATIPNPRYRIAPDVTVCEAETSRVRAFGRNRTFAGRSTEMCRIDWEGP